MNISSQRPKICAANLGARCFASGLGNCSQLESIYGRVETCSRRESRRKTTYEYPSFPTRSREVFHCEDTHRIHLHPLSISGTLFPMSVTETQDVVHPFDKFSEELLRVVVAEICPAYPLGKVKAISQDGTRMETNQWFSPRHAIPIKCISEGRRLLSFPIRPGPRPSL